MEDPVAKPERRRMVWIDALRGIASLSVVFGHYFWAYSFTLKSTVFDPGVFGVGIFFLISGFLVPVMSRAERRDPVVSFWLNRAFRLLPAYWTALLFGAIVYGVGLYDFLKNLPIIQVYFGESNVLTVAWTLQVEVLFYVWIAGCIWTKTLHNIRYLVAVTITVASVAVLFGGVREFLGVKAPLAIPVGLTIMYLGYWISLRRNGLVGSQAFATLMTIVVSLLVLSFFLGYDRDWGFDETPWRFVASDGAAAAVFCAALKFNIRKSPILLWAGSVSYPLYLLHQPFFEFFRQHLTSTPLFEVGGVAFAAAMVASFVVHKAIEQPMILLFRRIESRINLRPLIVDSAT